MNKFVSISLKRYHIENKTAHSIIYTLRTYNKINYNEHLQNM